MRADQLAQAAHDPEQATSRLGPHPEPHLAGPAGQRRDAGEQQRIGVIARTHRIRLAERDLSKQPTIVPRRQRQLGSRREQRDEVADAGAGGPHAHQPARKLDLILVAGAAAWRPGGAVRAVPAITP